MHSFFLEMRKLRDDVLTIVRSPSKIISVLHVPIYANAIFLMLSNVLTALFVFIFWIIAARLYASEEVGVASATITAVVLLSMLSELGFSFGLIRFMKSTNNPTKLINSSFTMTGLLSVLAACIFLIGLGLWSPGLSVIRQNAFYLVIFLVYVPVQVLDDLTDVVMIARRKAGFVVIHGLIFNILKLGLLLLMVVFFKSFGIFSSWSSSMLVALLACLFLILPRVQPGYHFSIMIDRREVSQILRFSFLNYLGDIFWNIPGLVLPLIVVNLLGATSNAYYYMAWMMSGVLTLIPSAMATSMFAEGTHDEEHLKIHVRRSLKMVAGLLVPGVIMVWFLANKLLLLYGGPYAKNATTLLRWFSIASFSVAINMMYFSIKRIQKNVRPVIFMGAFMAIIVIVASYLLLPRLGINGIGIAWLAGQSTIALIAIFTDMGRWIKS